MILIVGNFSAYRPEIAMDIEEIHIDGDLNTLLFQILLFKGLFKDYYLPVGNTCNEITSFRRRSISFRDTEKVCDEKHHPNEKSRQRY